MDCSGIVTFTSDFGLADGYAGAMRGAALSAAPGVGLVDITHEVRRHSIVHGAFVLRFACSAFPPGTAHCVVVDPGVGGERLPIAIRAGDHFFVGPDNGVLAPAVELLGGGRAAVLPVPPGSSNTFHGRDVFAPSAARLAAGLLDFDKLEALERWRPLDFPAPLSLGDDTWRLAVLHVDCFGNVVTNLHDTHPAARALRDRDFRIDARGLTVSRLFKCYEEAPGDEIFCIWGSAGLLELSLCRGDAAGRLGLHRLEEGTWPSLTLRLG